MTLTIQCDHVGADFKRCEAALSGLAFNAMPSGWTTVDLGHGDHFDYCTEHTPEPKKRSALGEELAEVLDTPDSPWVVGESMSHDEFMKLLGFGG